MFEKAVEIIKGFTETPVNEIKPESQLISDLGLNSLNIVEIVSAFEDAFDIEISDRSIKGLRTIGDVADLLEKNVSD